MIHRLFSLAVAVLLLPMAGIASAQQRSVPELDPGSAVSGVSLAVGAILLYLESRRRR
jgi:hypothetical protein